jgi:methylmalonyl-CoA mutase N-terminal domain/subunit
MPHFVDAADAGVTLGEICDVLRKAFGTYRPKEIVA